MEYSDRNAAASALSMIPPAPKFALPENANGYVLVRHDNSIIPARDDGQCAAEALHFASSRKVVGDAVQAAQRRIDGGVAFGDMNLVLAPWGYRLNTLAGFADGERLLFTDLFRANMQGIAVCETVAETHKGLSTHYVVADFWRRLIFLGVGELSLQWLAGIISVRGDDRLYLDERLHDLRIRSLTSVRMLWEQSERVRAQGKRRAGRNGSARKKRRAQGRM